MSKIKARKSRLEFETDSLVQGRAVVVQAHPHYAAIRLKGQHTGFIIPWDAVYHAAAKIAVTRPASYKIATEQGFTGRMEGK